MIRTNADQSDPVRSPDPISFIYVFTYVLCSLIPRFVTDKRKDDIHDVMGELAGIVTELDGSLWSESRKRCVKSTNFILDGYYDGCLDDQLLCPKLHVLNDSLSF